MIPHVLTLAAALATADASVAQLRADLECADHERQRVESERDAMEEERDTARSALDGLVAAVRAELEASHARIAGELSGAAMVRARAALDALLRGAPCGYVEARVVRESCAAIAENFGRVKAADWATAQAIAEAIRKGDDQ